MTDIDPDEARDVADEILSRPEFREQPRTLIDRALGWIGERLADVLSTFFGGDRGLVFGYVLLVVAAAVALYFGWRYFPRRRGPGPDEVITIETEILDRAGRDEWLDRARRASAAGRWAEAVHARFHALTTGLADAEQLSPEPSTTSGEHRRAFSGATAHAPERQARFAGIAGRYEEVWFGEEQAGAPDVEAATDADDYLLRPPS